MDKAEHALLRERMRALATKTLYLWLADYVRIRFVFLSDAERSDSLLAVREKLNAAREDYSSLALEGMTPEMSDLRCAEFQEAFDELAKELESSLASGKPMTLGKVK